MINNTVGLTLSFPTNTRKENKKKLKQILRSNYHLAVTTLSSKSRKKNIVALCQQLPQRLVLCCTRGSSLGSCRSHPNHIGRLGQMQTLINTLNDVLTSHSQTSVAESSDSNLSVQAPIGEKPYEKTL